MTAVILPLEVEYQPFTDEQIKSFAEAAGKEFANPDDSWRHDLNEAVRDLLSESALKDWPTPSAMRKQLAAVGRNPDKFIDQLENDAEFRGSSVAIAILHGARWHPAQLARAGEYRDQFIAGVKREIKWLNSIIAERKRRKVTGHGSDVALDRFIDRLAWIYQDAFLQQMNVGLSVPTNSRRTNYDAAPSGPFIRFAQAVMNQIASSLPADDLTCKVLRLTAMSGFAVMERMKKSDAYKVAKQLRQSDSNIRDDKP